MCRLMTVLCWGAFDLSGLETIVWDVRLAVQTLSRLKDNVFKTLISARSRCKSVCLGLPLFWRI
ncbi:MAG: hypothetical protein ACKESB_03265 [Candidatus Hodgkinia cicadicola]